MFTWVLGSLWFCVGLFAANAIWLAIYWRDRRVAEREHDSICDQIVRYGESEYDRLRGLVWTHEDTIRDHKNQIADRDEAIETLKAEREEAAKRILSLEDLYRAKCKETEEQTAGRDATIANLKAERGEAAKRILLLEDLYRTKSKETGAMTWEINAGRDVRAAAFELCEMLDQFVKGMDGARTKNLFAPETFQPKRPEEQPQKPMCDN